MDLFDKIKNSWFAAVILKLSSDGADGVFSALLKICPEGSRLTLTKSEPASFVIAISEWSHRSRHQHI